MKPRKKKFARNLLISHDQYWIWLLNNTISQVGVSFDTIELSDAHPGVTNLHKYSFVLFGINRYIHIYVQIQLKTYIIFL